MDIADRIAKDVLEAECEKTKQWLKSRPDYKHMLTGDLLEELMYLNGQLRSQQIANSEFGQYVIDGFRREKDAVSKELYWRKQRRLNPSISRRLISQEEKEAIKRSVSISQALAMCGIKSKGSKVLIPCPFHKDDTGSFYPNDDEGLWYCYGCQKGGDVFRLIELLRRVSFREAALFLGGDNATKRSMGTSGRRADGQAVATPKKLSGD